MLPSVLTAAAAAGLVVARSPRARDSEARREGDRGYRQRDHAQRVKLIVVDHRSRG